MVVGAAERVERGGRGIGAEADRAALVRGRAAVEGAGEHDRVAGGPEQLAHAGDQPVVGGHVGPAPVEDDGLAVDADPALGVGQVLAHQVPVDAVAASQDRAKPRRPAQVGLEDRAGDLAQELDIAERRAAAPVVEVEIVDAERLLIDGVVATARIDRQHRRAVVVHEIAADDAGAVGDARRAGVRERSSRAAELTAPAARTTVPARSTRRSPP